MRDSEREQLSRQAFTLCLQSLRTRVQSMGPPSPDNALPDRTDSRTRVLLDVYKIYQQVSKNFQSKEMQAFATLLVDTYKTYRDMKSSVGNLLEDAMRFCHQQNANKSKLTASQTSQQVQSIPPPAVTTAPSMTAVTQSQPIPTSPQTYQQRKPYKNPGTGRPRGRPPNVNKNYPNLMNSYCNNASKRYQNYLGTNNQPLMNPFFMNPLLESNAMMSMLSSGLNPSMMDSLAAVNYLSNLNQMGNSLDILRQYQNNLQSMPFGGYGNIPTSLPNVSSVPTMTSNTTIGSVPSVSSSNLGSINSVGNLTVQQLLNLSAAKAGSAITTNSTIYNQSTFKTTTANSTKELSHGVSISAVSSGTQQQKTKTKHSSINSDLSVISTKNIPPSQLKTGMPSSQVSLLKQTVIQQPKTTPPKQVSAPQIRVSKSLTEPQPAHSSSLSVSPLKSASPSGIMNIPSSHQNLGNSGLNITPVPMGLAPRSGTSLQHKLQKKQAQQAALPVKKPRTSSKAAQHAVNKLSTMLNMANPAALMGAPYLPPELSGISVNPVNTSTSSKSSIKPSVRKTSSKPKSSMEITSSMPTSLAQASNAETINMLTQLQQQPHLEIIAQSQSKAHSKSTDFNKNPPLSVSVVPPKTADNIRTNIPDSVSIFGIPQGKTTSSTSKPDKHANENVEIITLDD